MRTLLLGSQGEPLISRTEPGHQSVDGRHTPVMVSADRPTCRVIPRKICNAVNPTTSASLRVRCSSESRPTIGESVDPR